MKQEQQVEPFFLDKAECKALFEKQEIYIFGTGVDAEQVQKELAEDVFVRAYVDNNRAGKNSLFYGKRIISLAECLKERSENHPILVASYRFAMEISEQLKERGALPGKDYYIWDDMYLFHSDSNTQEYIDFLSNIWKPFKKNNTSNKILVAFDNKHDMQSVINAYCSNYFAQKYDASIYAYFRMGSSASNASKIIMDIYRAFNVEALIDTELCEEQKKEADEICDSLWSNLFTWEDWKNITIYGICFGTTIISHFLRVYVPSFNIRDPKMYNFLRLAVQTIVFWYHYINENDIRVVLLADGVTWDGYLRDIAITKGIPAYAICYKMNKLTLNYPTKSVTYPYYKEMWSQLTPEEQKYGLEWAEKQIEKRLRGGTEEVWLAHKDIYTFAEQKKACRVLNDNEKIKVVIFPHIFEEDSFPCGEQIFDNNYFAWLCHLGDLSEKTPQYDWYLKMHPNAQRRDYLIMDMFLAKYSRIKKVPSDISPIQLKEEGMKFALTIHGTIGHEFPEIGVQVINAGNNPHMAFDFTWNPKTKEEYDDLILNLEHLNKELKKEELYKFYSLYYLFYDKVYIDYRTLFFENPLLSMSLLELQANGKTLGTWKYRDYMKEWTLERHQHILGQMETVFQKLDDWRPDILYRKASIKNKRIV